MLKVSFPDLGLANNRVLDCLVIETYGQKMVASLADTRSKLVSCTPAEKILHTIQSS